MKYLRGMDILASARKFCGVLCLAISFNSCSLDKNTDKRVGGNSADALVATLPAPTLKITLQKDSNILEWDLVESASTYDLFVTSTTDVNFENAVRIENVQTPFVHTKEVENHLYSLIAHGESEQAYSERSNPVDDIPKGYLASCLSFADESKITLDAILEATELGDCYTLTPQIESIVALDLSAKALTDLTPLADLANLETLSVKDNLVTDIQSLVELRKLKTLNLSNNPELVSIENIGNLALIEELAFSDTSIADLTPIEGLEALRSLVMENTAVSSLAPVASLSKLETAVFTGNQVDRVENNCPTVSVMRDLARFCLEGVTITYTAQINPLMSLHCVSCHNANNPARIQLDNEVDVVNGAAQINARISDGTMPPGNPLSDTDKAIVATWYAGTILLSE